MGDLPAARITEARPFTNVGVDYCGSFYIKDRKDRNRRKIKVCVAIFVCLAVKVVHIELVSDLTSEAFIAVLRPTYDSSHVEDFVHPYTQTTVLISLAPTTNYVNSEISYGPTIIR
jgi:hypothetical protein